MSTTHDDPLAEALRIIETAGAAGLTVRLLGGLAFHAKAPTWTARIDRTRRDIDLATRARDVRGLTTLLVDHGYLADRQYNALNGNRQLYFIDPVRQRPIDVIIDQLQMCHIVDFRDRLERDHPTLPVTDLLLSKLQVVRINRKDVLDALVLFLEYPVGDDDGGIHAGRIASLAGADWGWWRTMTMNLAKIREYFLGEVGPDDLDLGRPPRHDALAGIAALEQRIADAPKGMGWKLRARVGDRVAWYEEPEEVGHPDL